MKLSLIPYFLAAAPAVAAAQDPHVIWDFVSGDGSNLGISTSTAGDLNQDGKMDFMHSIFDSVHIRSGSDGSDLLVISALGAWMGYPTACCTLGDIDGDGLPDYAISNGRLNRSWGLEAGGIGLYSGADGSLIYRIDGDYGGNYLGLLLQNAGDVNADGTLDLLVGSNLDVQSNGFARVYSGADGTELYTWYGEASDDNTFGRNAAAAGDVNLDGYADIIVGAYKNDDGGIEAGKASVFSGFDGSLLYAFTGSDPGQLFAMQVDGGMDANADGVPDLLVRAPFDGPSGSPTGAIRCYSGADGSLLWSAANHKYFADIGFIGDINGDDFDDVAGCNPADDTQLQILSGFDGTQLWVLDGDRPLTHSAVISPLGDVDGDGMDDFFATALDRTDLGNHVYVYGGVYNSHQLTLQVENPLTAGTPATVMVLGTPSSGLVQLYRGTGHGRSYSSLARAVDLQQATWVASGLPNAAGNTRFNIHIPPSFLGMPLWLQATSAIGETSNVEYRVVL
jgi:FG-GAP repeat protein